MPSKVRKEKLITVVTTEYIELLVIDLLERAFDVYKRRSYKGRHRLVSILENTFSTAGILLTVVAIEGWANRIQYLLKDRSRPPRPSVFLSKTFKKHKTGFPEENFLKLTDEVFSLRDVIAHNHIFELAVTKNASYDLLSQRQKLLPQYGDPKLIANVNKYNRKTHFWRLNTQPSKIGFEDLFKVLAYHDLFVHLSKMVLGTGFVSTGGYYKFREKWEDNLASILATLFTESKDPKFRREFNTISKQLRKQYRQSLSSGRDKYFNQLEIPDITVAHNECPKCGMFGYHKACDVSYCHACKHKIKFVKLTPEQKKLFFGRALNKPHYPVTKE